MKYISISHKKYYQNGRIFNFSSEIGNNLSINNILRDEGHWANDPQSTSENEYFIIEYNTVITIDLIQLIPGANGPGNFPKNFRIETSINGEVGRGILGVIDGFSPKGVEDSDDFSWRKKFLRDIKYKL